MKKNDLKKLALLGLTGGIIVASESVQASTANDANQMIPATTVHRHGCPGANGCGGAPIQQPGFAQNVHQGYYPQGGYSGCGGQPQPYYPQQGGYIQGGYPQQAGGPSGDYYYTADQGYPSSSSYPSGGYPSNGPSGGYPSGGPSGGYPSGGPSGGYPTSYPSGYPSQANGQGSSFPKPQSDNATRGTNGNGNVNNSNGTNGNGTSIDDDNNGNGNGNLQSYHHRYYRSNPKFRTNVAGQYKGIQSDRQIAGGEESCAGKSGCHGKNGKDNGTNGNGSSTQPPKASFPQPSDDQGTAAQFKRSNLQQGQQGNLNPNYQSNPNLQSQNIPSSSSSAQDPSNPTSYNTNGQKKWWK